MKLPSKLRLSAPLLAIAAVVCIVCIAGLVRWLAWPLASAEHRLG